MATLVFKVTVLLNPLLRIWQIFPNSSIVQHQLTQFNQPAVHQWRLTNGPFLLIFVLFTQSYRQRHLATATTIQKNWKNLAPILHCQSLKGNSGLCWFGLKHLQLSKVHSVWRLNIFYQHYWLKEWDALLANIDTT